MGTESGWHGHVFVAMCTIILKSYPRKAVGMAPSRSNVAPWKAVIKAVGGSALLLVRYRRLCVQPTQVVSLCIWASD